jgi:hypothetical protein
MVANAMAATNDRKISPPTACASSGAARFWLGARTPLFITPMFSRPTSVAAPKPRKVVIT